MFEHLFKPIKINQMIVKNRIVAAPVNDSFEEKALGGAGLVICGHTIVEPGRSSYKSRDECTGFEKYERQETRRKVLKVHQAGAKAAIEIFHGGQEARVVDYAKGPTDMIREDGTIVKAMTREMMDETLHYYYESARNAKEIGFDCLFMHFGHGWLAAQFLSPYFNKREDEYGGSLENRMKFPLEILKTVREAVGPTFPIDMRISAYEWVEGSIELRDVIFFIQKASQYIDMVQISAGLDMNREANVHTHTTNFEERMPNVKWARKIKKNVAIPVSVVGAILNPQDADTLIKNGDVDLVAFGRSFLADPYWPKKALEQRPEDIRPCLRCLNCYHISTDHWNVGCSVNPAYNNDFVSNEIMKAENKKKVVIVGAGPVGMQAAITAYDRGHDVILLEKNNELGGQLIPISKEYYKTEIKDLLHHLKAQIQKRRIDVRLTFEADKENIKELNPDALIIAIGAKEVNIPIKGKETSNVIMALDAINHPEKLGNNIVILGGGTIGAELGLELSLVDKKNVTIVELGNEIAAKGNLLYKIALRQKMKQADTLKICLNTNCIELKDNVAYLKKGKEITEVSFDTFIMAVGLRNDINEVESLYNIIPNTVHIGDCSNVANIMNAIFEGYNVALHI